MIRSGGGVRATRRATPSATPVASGTYCNDADLKAKKGGCGAEDAAGRGGRWFRSSGGGRAARPGERSGVGLGDITRRRFPHGLAQPDR